MIADSQSNIDFERKQRKRIMRIYASHLLKNNCNCPLPEIRLESRSDKTKGKDIKIQQRIMHDLKRRFKIDG